MSTWLQDKLKEAHSKKKVQKSVPFEDIPTTTNAPVDTSTTYHGGGNGAPAEPEHTDYKGLSWAQRKIKDLQNKTTQPQPTWAAEQLAAGGGGYIMTEPEGNIAITAGKRAFSTVWHDMLPSINLAAGMGTNVVLKGFEDLANNTFGRIPGMAELDKYLQENVGAMPALSELQKKYFLQADVALMEEQQKAGAEFTKDLIKSWDQVNDPLTAANWLAGSLGSLAPQILAAAYTGGSTALLQSTGSIYHESNKSIAKERGITVQQVVDQNLDERSVAIVAGMLTGAVETLGAKGATGLLGKGVKNKWIMEGVKKFMASPAGKVFRNKMVQVPAKIAGASLLEKETEEAQTVIEHIGKVGRSGESLSENLKRIKAELTDPETIKDIKESGRQGAVGGGGVRGITIAVGADNKINIPKTNHDFATTVLITDESKLGPSVPPISRVVHQDPSKLDKPVISPAADTMIKDANGKFIHVKIQQVDVGLVDEKSGLVETIEQTLDPTGLASEFSFNGKTLKATTIQEATAEVLAISEADRKIVYPVAGDILIQKVATNEDGTVDYATGLKDTNTGKPIIIKENPATDGPKFSAYNGGVVGNSVQDVADQIQDIGTPKVSTAQGRRANDILKEEGVSLESLTRIYKDVFGYNKQQAGKQAAAVMAKVDQEIHKVKLATTPTELEKENGAMRKQVVLTPEQAFTNIAKGMYGERAAKIETLIESVRKAEAKANPAAPVDTTPIPEEDGDGRVGIKPTPTAKKPKPAKQAPTPAPSGLAEEFGVRDPIREQNPEKYPSGKHDKGGVTYDDVYDFVKDMGWENTAYKEVFAYLKGRGIKMRFNFDGPITRKDGTATVGQYDANTREISVQNHSPLRTLGHEALHAILYESRAWQDNNFRKRLDGLRTHLRKQMTDADLVKKHMIGLSSAEIKHYIDYTLHSGSMQEIVTHALTLPGYAKFLANIPASKGSLVSEGGDSIWTRISEAILRFANEKLGFSDNALNELNTLLSDYVGADIDVRAKDTFNVKGNPALNGWVPTEEVYGHSYRKPGMRHARITRHVSDGDEVFRTSHTSDDYATFQAAEAALIKVVRMEEIERKGRLLSAAHPGAYIGAMINGEFVDGKVIGVTHIDGGGTVINFTDTHGKERFVNLDDVVEISAGESVEELTKNLPIKQRTTLTTGLNGKQFEFQSVGEFGDEFHPLVYVKIASGEVFAIDHTGKIHLDVREALEASRKAPVEPEPMGRGEAAGPEQPSMQGGKDDGGGQLKLKKKKLPEPPPPPQPRTPVDQPSVNPTETVDTVVQLLYQTYDIMPKQMSRKELLGFIANLDEEGRPMGSAKAFAIVEHMVQMGLVKPSGAHKLDILFSSNPQSVIVADPNVDYKAESAAAAKAAKAAAQGTIQAQMQKDMLTQAMEFVRRAPAGIASDAGALAKSFAETFGVSLEVATGLIQTVLSTKQIFKGGSISSFAKAFVSAWWNGDRGAYLAALGKGLGLQLNRLTTLKPLDFINPMSYVRLTAAIISSSVSIVQAGVKMGLGNIEPKFISPLAKQWGNWMADRAKIGVTSQNKIIQNATKLMSGFYRALTYTDTEVRRLSQMRGQRQHAAQIAMEWMDELYTLIGRNQESLAKVHAVLDPEGYAKTQYAGTTFAMLGSAEQAVYAALRTNMDHLHNWSLKKGYINEETFLKFINEQGEINYFGRAYQQFFDEQAMGEDVVNLANSLRADFTIYKHRQDFKDIKGLDLERDPVFIAAMRMATAMQNQAVTDYAETIYNNPQIPKFKNTEAYRAAGSPSGFSQLGAHGVGGVYGPLSGTYLPNYVVYDFKGFFFSAKGANSVYTAMKSYDQLWFRRKQKELLTVYNPGVVLGNYASNYTFAYLNGVDAFNYNHGLLLAKEAIKTRNDLYKKLLAEGLLGTGISTELRARLPVRLEDQIAQQKKDKKSLVGDIKDFAERNIEDSYAQIDDAAKISAYYVKTHVYGMSHDQAITEIMQGFQNYDSVGRFFDVSSKLPVFGNAFAKFQGDLMRIIGTSVSHRPLTTLSYLGIIYALNEITSGLSDEDELEKKIRQGRKFQPRIPVPFLNDLPLGWKFGKHEVNVARLIAPFQVYDKGEPESGLWTLAEFLPVRSFVLSSGGKPAYVKFDDPMLGPLMSIFFDNDFRNVSISDPHHLAGDRGRTILDVGSPEWNNSQRLMNRAEFYFRSFGMLPTTAMDIYHIHTSGEDYYGRKKSTFDRLVSTVIRVEEFSTPEAQQAVQREIDSRSKEINVILKENNQMVWRFKKQAEIIAMKNITQEQKAYQLRKNWEMFIEALGDSGPRLRTAVEGLYEPANYGEIFKRKVEP